MSSFIFSKLFDYSQNTVKNTYLRKQIFVERLRRIVIIADDLSIFDHMLDLGRQSDHNAFFRIIWRLNLYSSYRFKVFGNPRIFVNGSFLNIMLALHVVSRQK